MDLSGWRQAPSPLARQGSIYSLTFDEFQSTLGGAGKDFGSMNMDELLRNIWTAEESHSIAASTTAAPSVSGAYAADPPLPIQRQGSLTLPRTLSQKTVDEVWRNIMGFGALPPAAPVAPSAGELQCRRQPTLGEMTLEEFLVRAGVVREEMPPPAPPPTQPVAAPDAAGPQGVGRSNGNAVPGGLVTNMPMVSPLPPVRGNANLGNSQGIAGLSNGFMSGVVGLGAGAGGGVTVGSPTGQLASDGIGKANGHLSSLSPVPYVFSSGGLRGRKGPAVEKVVERRQRRMIKNRESAARSRQRKQAYMMELEAEVAKLKEQNEELQKKQAEMLEKEKKEVLERIAQQLGPKRICLRRTLTGPW